ncbi:MAG: cysteine desulfurase [Planctomycetaceae bacterium]|nr:cysteine desulfurase [Planctomycetaceae bacterium]
MPVTRKWAYFDNAAVGPLPTPTRDAVLRWADEGWQDGDTLWPQWAAGIEQTRRTAAAMIAGSTEEIALIPNTTTGIGLVAEGYPWCEGDNIVTLANEFPSNLYPWMNLASRGVETRLVPVDGVSPDLNRVLETCDELTRIIAISWVGYANGYRIDVGEVVKAAHERGILVLLDAIQGLGVFPLNVQDTNIDFLAADGHKWMLGPEGAGILYVRRDHLQTLRPLNVGWNSVVHKYDYSRIELNLRDTAARYEGGSQNMVGLLGLGASLNLLSACGVGPNESAVGDRVLEISDFACQRLREVGAKVSGDRSAVHRSGIVAFDMPRQDLVALRQRCLENGVVLSHRADRLRISPHAYCNEDDVERLITNLL